MNSGRVRQCTKKPQNPTFQPSTPFSLMISILYEIKATPVINFKAFFPIKKLFYLGLKGLILLLLIQPEPIVKTQFPYFIFILDKAFRLISFVLLKLLYYLFCFFFISFLHRLINFIFFLFFKRFYFF